MATTTARRSYDRNPEGEPAAAEPRVAPAPKKEGTHWFKMLLIGAGSAVAAVAAVDMYRKITKGGGGGGDEEREAPAAAPAQTALPGQTFIPMPVPFPMPMMMPGGGYMQQGQMPSPPSRNGAISEEDEERIMVKRYEREQAAKRAARAIRRKQIDEMTADFMDD